MSTSQIVVEDPVPLTVVVQAIRQATGWSQNGVARRARVNGGLLSGLLSGKFKSREADRRVRCLAEKLRKAGKLDWPGVLA
jgi:transcriptional regulator with XRE-family HTH domain